MERDRKPRRAPALDEGDAADDDDDEHAEAFARALEENPELKSELDESVVKKATAAAEKELGNTAFKSRDYQTAVKHFSAAIAADNTDAVLYSNRSAAYAAQQDYDAALADAKQCVTLKPGWAKSWARLGAAHVGLEEYTEAKDAYFKALEVEPDDNSYRKSWEQADYNERQQSQQHKHTFKKRKPEPTGGRESKRRGQKGPLSFDDDEEEGEGGGGG